MNAHPDMHMATYTDAYSHTKQDIHKVHFFSFKYEKISALQRRSRTTTSEVAQQRDIYYIYYYLNEN